MVNIDVDACELCESKKKNVSEEKTAADFLIVAAQVREEQGVCTRLRMCSPWC